MDLLSQINSPGDLKTLSRHRLPVLADEIRHMIVDVISVNGGHLASSLGSVELAIALHYVFKTPLDKIIWDVGHQSYAHKILTGRRDRFPTIRKNGGLSGFTRMSESPYDAFSTGHSSTSISAGLGMSCAKAMKHEKNKVIAVIGDGSLTAGMAYEGLNQAGDSDRDLIVILNDNDMSISKNVGALSSLLSRAFSGKKMQDLRKEVGDFLKSLPKIGDDIYHLVKRSEESFMTFISPGMLFEAFGFEYFGPINGHNLEHLVDILNNIKMLSEPVLLHVTTRKGKGYEPAEKNPVYFHGVGSFEIKTGHRKPKKSQIPTYTQVFGEAMIRLAETNDRIVAVTAAMPEGTGLTQFSELYPDRFFDVGIAEQHGVTFAAGMAVEGLRPVVAIYSTFLQRAYDQILHDVCLESLPVIFALDRGGVVGADGPTHHGVFDLSYLRSMPNMTVMAPRDENELCAMLATAIHHDGPIAMRYPRGSAAGAEIEKPYRPIPIGVAELLTDGTDILLIAVGSSVQEALDACPALEEKGISTAVLNARFVKPLDQDKILSLAKRIPRIITVEENALQGGFGSAVLECLCDAGVSGLRLIRIGLPDQFIEHGDQKELRARYRIDKAAIVETAERLMAERPRLSPHPDAP